MERTKSAKARRAPITVLAVLALLAAACGGGSPAGGGDFCDQARQIADDDFEPDPKEVLPIFEQLERSAPAAISDDISTIIDGYEEMLRYLEEGDPTTEPDVNEAELDASTRRVEAFVEEECGIDLETDEEAAGDFEGDEDSQTGALGDGEDTPATEGADQTATLSMSGTVNADQSFEGEDIECGYLQGGQFWFTAYPEGDTTWSLEIFTPEIETLEPGEHPIDYSLAVPPFESEMSENGESFLAEEAGTITIESVGEIQDTDTFSRRAQVDGRYETTLVSMIDGSEVEVSGDFSCASMVLEQ